jgi:hypothetical protein
MSTWVFAQQAYTNIKTWLERFLSIITCLKSVSSQFEHKWFRLHPTDETKWPSEKSTVANGS